MAVITRSAHPKALWPGIKAWWGRMYDEHSPEYPDLFDEESSDKAYEEDVEVTGFGLAPEKPEGQTVTYDMEQQGNVARYTHVGYGLGYIVTHEEIEDNLYEVVSKRRAEALAFSMRQTKETILANIYNRAFNPLFPGSDGVSIVNAAHPTVNGTQSNVAANPADLSETALEDMHTQVGLATNSRGLKISLQIMSLHIPVNEWWNANRILKSVLQNDTANNAINVLKAVGAIPRGPKQNHYFTSDSAWFVRTNAPRGMIYYNREAVSFKQDNDFDTENAKAKCYERYSGGNTDFRGIYANPGV